MRKANQIIAELLKTPDYSNFLPHITGQQVTEALAQYFPKLTQQHPSLENLLLDGQFYGKVKKAIEMHNELMAKAEEVAAKVENKGRQNEGQGIEAVSKKVTRAALARRHEKNQEQMRKDQIFVRLTPKSQSCIQFMLCNRNFPRMEVKLSCNQHLQYLVNYLSTKWIRGKVGVRVVLYPDSSFLKTIPLSDKQKTIKEPLNNYLMFTDIMTCCGVHQNGVLNMTYDIVQTKKNSHRPAIVSIKETPRQPNYADSMKMSHQISKGRSQGQSSEVQVQPERLFRPEESNQGRVNSPEKYSHKDDYLHEGSMFRNSNFFANNEQSMFGSLGFNFNFGNAPRKDDPFFSLNSNPYDSYFPDLKKSRESLPLQVQQEQASQENASRQDFTAIKDKIAQKRQPQIKRVGSEDKKQNSQQKENELVKEDPNKKLDNLMSLLDQIEKEKDLGVADELNAGEQANNSNRFKEVKTVSIVKKKTTYN